MNNNYDSIELKEVAKGLNGISWDILDILSKKEDISYTDLKKMVNISQEKLNKEVARLEGALLIKNAINARDRRILMFNISDYGLKILRYR